ncbi:restriction endonuclease subunit S [Candidatus Avelusimicrobium sp.]
MNKEFPNTKFGTLVLAQPKSNIKAGEGKTKGIFPFFTSSPVQTKYLDKYIYQGPAIIFGTGGGASVHACEGPFATSTDCLVYYPASKNVYIKYLYRYLLGNIHILQRGFKGAGLQHISKTYIENLDISFPNIKEQESIVERLDKVQELIALQKEQLKKMDDLIKSRFIDLFGDPITNPKKWIRNPFHSLVKEMFIGPFGSDLKNENYVRPEQGYCVVYEQKHAIYHSINLEFRYIDEMKYKQLRRFLVKPGDFIMSCRGTIGKIYQLPPQAPYGIIHSSLMKISLDMEKVNSEYFQWLLASIIKNSTKDGGVIKMAITAKNLGKKNVPIPPLSLQTQFADFVTKIEAQKGLLNTRLTHLETLYKSLMQEYFG